MRGVIFMSGGWQWATTPVVTLHVGCGTLHARGHPARGVRHPARGVRQPGRGVRHPARGVWHLARGVWHPGRGVRWGGVLVLGRPFKACFRQSLQYVGSRFK